MGGNGISGTGEDNNQASIRNPPGAYHNAGSALAQNNLLGYIIQQIKMQSVGIWKRLLTCFETTRQEIASKIAACCQNHHKMFKILKLYKQQQQQLLTMNNTKIKMLIELCAHIGNLYWNLLQTIPTLPLLQTTIITTTTIVIIETSIDEVLEQMGSSLISNPTEATSCAIDKHYNERTNEHLDSNNENSKRYNNSNNNNYINNCNRYKRNRKQDYNKHRHCSLTMLGKSRQQIISKCNTINNNNNDNNNNNICITDDYDGEGNKKEDCRMLATPLATCASIMLELLLLLLLLLLYISFPIALHLYSNDTTNNKYNHDFSGSGLMLTTTHFISILSDKRVFSTLYRHLTKIYNNDNNSKGNDKKCSFTKINSGLLFNNGEFLNAIKRQQIQADIKTSTTNILYSLQKIAIR